MRSWGNKRHLDALPSRERQRFLKNCVLVDLALGETLARPHEPVRYVYFPTEGYISIVTEMGGSRGLEVALVGNEGALGSSLALGVRVSPFLAVVQGAGPAWRISATRFSGALGNCGALRQVIQAYLFVQMSQLGQTAGCTRVHLLEHPLPPCLSITPAPPHPKTFQITHPL